VSIVQGAKVSQIHLLKSGQTPAGVESIAAQDKSQISESEWSPN
jgi:hypothetical protein